MYKKLFLSLYLSPSCSLRFSTKTLLHSYDGITLFKVGHRIYLHLYIICVFMSLLMSPYGGVGHANKGLYTVCTVWYVNITCHLTHKQRNNRQRVCTSSFLWLTSVCCFPPPGDITASSEKGREWLAPKYPEARGHLMNRARLRCMRGWKLSCWRVGSWSAAQVSVSQEQPYRWGHIPLHNRRLPVLWAWGETKH